MGKYYVWGYKNNYKGTFESNFKKEYRNALLIDRYYNYSSIEELKKHLKSLGVKSKDLVIIQTLEDLFCENKEYVVEIPMEKEENGFCLFVEGLDNLGCCINDSFKLDNIKNLCIEITLNGEFCENIDTTNINLNTTIEELKKEFIKELKRGYKIITGLNNVSKFTQKQILDYMREILLEG